MDDWQLPSSVSSVEAALEIYLPLGLFGQLEGSRGSVFLQGLDNQVGVRCFFRGWIVK